jgi:hypothetical protein
MYRCKNSTIGFIIMRFKALILRAPDKPPNALECIVFYYWKVLIFQDLRINSTDDEVGEAGDMAIFIKKMFIF